MPEVCSNPWQTYGCEWGLRSLWRWMDVIGRVDVILLALILVHIVIVVARVSYCYHIARQVRGMDTATRAFQRTRRQLVADLSLRAGTLRSIALTAPYLGLAGTCFGILNSFRGYVGAKWYFIVMTASLMAAALVPTTVGLLVAVAATWSYNHLRTRIDLLEGDIPGAVEQGSRPFQVAQKLPLKARFSTPLYATIAAPALAGMVMAFLSFASFHTPQGLVVELASARCQYDEGNRLVVLRITDVGKLLLNQEPVDWNSLAGRLSEIYRMRVGRTVYLVADNGVSFQTVADAIDIAQNVTVESTSLDIRVCLVTRETINDRCPEAVEIDTSRGVVL